MKIIYCEKLNNFYELSVTTNFKDKDYPVKFSEGIYLSEIECLSACIKLTSNFILSKENFELIIEFEPRETIINV
jgi:hypothetical protein